MFSVNSTVYWRERAKQEADLNLFGATKHVPSAPNTNKLKRVLQKIEKFLYAVYGVPNVNRPIWPFGAPHFIPEEFPRAEWPTVFRFVHGTSGEDCKPSGLDAVLAAGGGYYIPPLYGGPSIEDSKIELSKSDLAEKRTPCVPEDPIDGPGGPWPNPPSGHNWMDLHADGFPEQWTPFDYGEGTSFDPDGPPRKRHDRKKWNFDCLPLCYHFINMGRMALQTLAHPFVGECLPNHETDDGYWILYGRTGGSGMVHFTSDNPWSCCAPTPLDFYWTGGNPFGQYFVEGKTPNSYPNPRHELDEDTAWDGSPPDISEHHEARTSWRGFSGNVYMYYPFFNYEFGYTESWLPATPPTENWTQADEWTGDPNEMWYPKNLQFGYRGLRSFDVVDNIHIDELEAAIDYAILNGRFKYQLTSSNCTPIALTDCLMGLTPV